MFNPLAALVSLLGRLLDRLSPRPKPALRRPRRPRGRRPPDEV